MDLRVSSFVEKLSPEPEFHKQSLPRAVENNTRVFSQQEPQALQELKANPSNQPL